MAFWEPFRNTIGQNRTWALGRVIAGAYFLLVGIYVMLVGLAISIAFAALDGLFLLVLDRPLNTGRAWAHALFHHQLLIGKYSLGMTPYPGALPRREHGERF